MESKRQQKVARLLQKELGEIFQQDAKHLFNQAFITVTTVRVTPDLGIARVYLSFLLVNNKKEALEDIQDKTRAVRQLLGQRIGKSLRIVPELHFYLDDTAEYASHIDALLDSLDIPPADEDTPSA
ncbi:MAG: 30S ribosome-binding factor RbfA [Microscillaceae bacterium]|nr:30S ribosome-binding factor RbfA [Microscillaceae bacterium]